MAIMLDPTTGQYYTSNDESWVTEDSYASATQANSQTWPAKTVVFVNSAFHYPPTGYDTGYYAMNSLTDYNVILQSVNVGGAAPKLKYIDVPYRDSQIDITSYFGDVKFNNRTITMSFLIPWRITNPRTVYSNMASDIGGMRKKVSFASDKTWYYEGRVSVGDLKLEDNGFYSFDVTLDAHPYKMQDIGLAASGSGTLIMECPRMVSQLSFKPLSSSVTASGTLVNGAGESILINSRTYTTEKELYKAYLTPGTNRLTYTTSGSGVFYYKKGRL